MNSKRISSTLIATVVTVLLIGLVGAQFNVRGVQDNADPNVEGSWEVTVMPSGGDPIIDFATFSAGGGMVNTDPDPNLSTGIGSWEKIGPNQYNVTFVHFLSDQGAPLGTLKVRAKMTVDPQANTFSGTFWTDVVIGGNVVHSICGTVQGRRLHAEAVEACPQP